MHNITPTQKKLYDFIVKYRAENGYSPSLEEMKTGTNNKSKGNIARLINCMKKNGHLIADRYVARSIRPTNEKGI